MDKSMQKLSGRRSIAFFSAIVLLATNAFADNAVSKVDSGDTAWVLVSAALVLFMTPGVGLFYGGLVRRKNAVSILIQSFTIIALVGLQWAAFGYSLAFGPDIAGLIGGLNWAGLTGILSDPNPVYAATIPQSVFIMFQAMFAIITPALIIGATTDRMKFSTLCIFVLLWSTIVYDPVAHWVWGSGGWLKNAGALDFAGGIVVHVTAGVSALAAAIVLGRRRDHGAGNLVPHNVPMVILGGGVLWFGWFGFNAGSALEANAIAGNAFLVTNTAACAAAITWMLISWIHMGKPNAVGIVTGAVVGLATITPAAGYVGVPAAVIIGAFASVVSYVAMYLKNTRTKIDDSLDVFACHGLGGTIGALAIGIFASKAINPAGGDGLLAGGASLLGTQVLAVAATWIYSFVVTIVILKVLDALMGLRVSAEEEEIGLDLTQHGEKAYT